MEICAFSESVRKRTQQSFRRFFVVFVVFLLELSICLAFRRCRLASRRAPWRPSACRSVRLVVSSWVRYELGARLIATAGYDVLDAVDADQRVFATKRP